MIGHTVAVIKKVTLSSLVFSHLTAKWCAGILETSVFVYTLRAKMSSGLTGGQAIDSLVVLAVYPRN